MGIKLARFRTLLLGCLGLGLGVSLAGLGYMHAAAQQPSAPASTPAAHRAVVDQYCVVCHNGQLKTASLELDSANIEIPASNSVVWEKVIRKLRMQAMPPQGMPRPDKATYDSLVSYLETSLDKAAAEKLNPGRPALHRLNRAEYANTIRDLLAVDTNAINITELLPTDDAGYGFDNIGDVLTVSPLLMEGYLAASRRISRVAVGDRTAEALSQNYEVPRYLIQQERMSEDLPLGSRGGIAVRHNFPADGEYTLRVRLQRNGKTYIVGLAHPRQLDVRLDGQRIKQFTVGGDYQGKRPEQASSFNQGDFERYLMNADQRLEMRFQAKAGTRLVQVTFPDQIAEQEGVLQSPVTDYAYAWDYGRPDDLEPAVERITIGGPFNSTGISETVSRRRIFTCTPANANEEDACATRILSTLARRAFRRPATDSDVQDLFTFYQSGKVEGGFEEGIATALQRILVDPEFLFRVEKDPSNIPPGTAHRVTDLELASRLSFFLWSSIPDDQLLQVAEKGELGKPEVLEQQVKRMLVDPRSEALVKNFAGQWLYLRNVEQVWPNPDVFPDFDANLRESFKKESELFFASQLKENRSVLNLINADYTFVNERLAKHYGIPNVYGSHFRRVAMKDENRQGLLGQGSILTVTSYATRTAPTIRGRWLLENVLGTPPPPPPANVPSLDLKKGDDGKVLTMRQQMEMHRANPVCASCHRVMDPLGFALENFDATGGWRTTDDSGAPLDTSGVTPNGFQLKGPKDLRAYLVSNPDQFTNTVAEKLLTYALGRGVESYDAPAIRTIMRGAKPENYTWSSLILGIVKSTPFQMRRSRES
jgi:mono/diheme cytochrome c family protein